MCVFGVKSLNYLDFEEVAYLHVFYSIVGYELSASVEPIISPVILNMWASHISDPFVSMDSIEVLEVILWSIVGRCNNIFTCV